MTYVRILTGKELLEQRRKEAGSWVLSKAGLAQGDGGLGRLGGNP